MSPHFQDKLVPFSKKQRQLMSWWHPSSPVHKASGIIADGAIRAGKTLPTSLGFIEWAFHTFNRQNFAICGKTVGSVRRNIVQANWFKPLLMDCGYGVQEKRTENLITLSKSGQENRFYVFGGRDESSQDLIQGLTLAGVLFDEVALMPESFVNQATGRCSVEGAKLWFNCNPDGPEHWFKKRWLDKRKEKGLLHVHFTMPENPSLGPEILHRYETMYSGVFYKRFILGEWCAADGLIYSMFGPDNQYDTPFRPGDDLWDRSTHYVGIDVGTFNPTVFLHAIDDGETFWINGEYYYSGRDTNVQKSDSQFGDDYDTFIWDKPILWAIIDPSASSFATELQMRGHPIRKGKTKGKDNFDKSTQDPHTILAGVRMVANLLSRGRIKVCVPTCPNLIREFGSYIWDEGALKNIGAEKPVKQNDHCLDALRYIVRTIIKEQPWRLGMAANE